ncbi:MAG: M48 family metallopeptidase [Parachlamydiaceae bacterium]
MAMNFWEAQQRARKRTAWCVCAFILLTIGVAVLSEVAMRYFAEESYDPPLPYLGIGFLGATFVVALFQYGRFRSSGGAYVAESLGGIRIDPNTASFQEKQLLNIVEEIAVASTVPIPPVYLLPANEINAFAAGLTPQDAVIAVTVGCLKSLTRDELQGVVAHEFGHIYNGDMTINMRVAAMVMGFFFILYIGFRMLQLSGMRSSRSDKKGANPVALAALIFIVAGAFTWFAGTLLKCMISRQREYLADASSVQFTRNPQGIANALRKIANEQVHDMPKSGMAYSHMYFEDTSFFSVLFATHPPIEKRIAAIEKDL